MNKSEALAMIATAKERAKQRFPQFAKLIDDTTVYPLTSQNEVGKRNSIAAEIGASPVQELEDTAAQAIVGERDYAIIIFYQRIRPHLFCHFLYHEYGHIISIASSREVFNEAQRDLDLDRDTLMRSGMAVWSELIAEVIAYRIEDSGPSNNLWYVAAQMESLMDEAVNGQSFSPYAFAFYCAMFFEDPTVQNYLYYHPDAAIGANHCDDDIMPHIEDALKIVSKQLGEEDYWSIKKDDLCALGEVVNNLWSYCYNRYEIDMLSRFRNVIQDELKRDNI